jgi:hypothetical protein
MCRTFIQFMSASAPCKHVWTPEKNRLILIILQCNTKHKNIFLHIPGLKIIQIKIPRNVVDDVGTNPIMYSCDLMKKHPLQCVLNCQLKKLNLAEQKKKKQAKINKHIVKLYFCSPKFCTLQHPLLNPIHVKYSFIYRGYSLQQIVGLKADFIYYYFFLSFLFVKHENCFQM